MARPSTSRINPIEISPQQQGSTQRAIVAAPINVGVGQSGAERLGAALGMFTGQVSPGLQQKANDQAEASTVAGMRDQQLGTLDQKRVEEDEYYARGQKRVLTDRATLDAIAEWQTRYDKGEIDKSNTDKVSEDFNSFMQQKLGSLIGDPEAAGWALAKLAPYQTRVLTDLQAEQAKAFREEAVASVGDSMRVLIKSGQHIDFDAEKQKLAAAGLNKGEATQSLVEQIGAMAVEFRDPSLLDQLPEHWPDGTPGPRSVPALLEKINNSRYYAEMAESAARQQREKTLKAQGDRDFIEASVALRNGDMTQLATLDRLFREGKIERAEWQATINFAQSQQDRRRQESVNNNAMVEFYSQLSEGQFSSEREAFNAANRLLPSGPDGNRILQQMRDDITQSFRAREDGGPLAKAYRQKLVSEFNPGTGVGVRMSDRQLYGQILLSFDRELVASNGDAEKAMAAAQTVIDSGTKPKNTAGKPATPTGLPNGVVVTEIK